jgi:hypothetical protein
VTAKIERARWLRNRGRRFYLRGRVAPTAISDFVLPGGNAP